LKTRWRGITLGCALLLAGIAAGACNDDGSEPASAEDYFDKLDEVDRRFEEASDALDRRSEELEDDDVDGARDLFEDLIALIEEFVDDLQDLDPPEAASEAHEEAIENFRQAREDFSEALDEAGDADSVEEFVGAIFGSADSRAAEAATEACLSLERIAAENDITLDLSCEEEE
jgi:tetratricopeptide (TPR) repeat protein